MIAFVLQPETTNSNQKQTVQISVIRLQGENSARKNDSPINMCQLSWKTNFAKNTPET